MGHIKEFDGLRIGGKVYGKNNATIFLPVVGPRMYKLLYNSLVLMMFEELLIV